MVNKKERNCRIVDFAIQADHRGKLKEYEKKDKYIDLDGELKNKTVEHVKDNYTNCNLCFWYSHQKIGTKAEGLGNIGTAGEWPIYSIVEIGLNTEKSPGDLRRLAVTETLLENHQLTLMWTTLKEKNENDYKCQPEKQTSWKSIEK